MQNISNCSTMDINSLDFEKINYSQLISLMNSTNYPDYPESEDNEGDFCEADKLQENVIKIFQVVFCLVFLLGVIGNCLVIATFALYRRLRLRSMTDIFLFNLALADLLLLLTLPLQTLAIHLGWIFTEFLCKTTRACYAINTFSGLLLLACISVDRYLVVAKAQEMLRVRSIILRTGMAAAAGVWIVAVLLSLPEIFYSKVFVDSYSGTDEYYCVMQTSGWVKNVPIGAVISIFCISLITMVMCYSSIGLVLWEGHTHRRGKQWHRQRTLKLMMALVLLFLVFQLPHTAVLSLKLPGGFCHPVLEYITCTLAYTRCSMNPILYALVGVRFRKDVLHLMQTMGCPCGFRVRLQSLNSTSNSGTAPVMLSLVSPALRNRCSSSEGSSLKFQFPGGK